MNKDLKEEREGKEMTSQTQAEEKEGKEVMSRNRTSSVPEPQNAPCVRHQQGIQSQVMGGDRIEHHQT